MRRGRFGRIYKYIQFSDKNVNENIQKIDTLEEKSLWFGCPWKMNDPTEFFMSYDEDEFINANEKNYLYFRVLFLWNNILYVLFQKYQVNICGKNIQIRITEFVLNFM